MYSHVIQPRSCLRPRATAAASSRRLSPKPDMNFSDTMDVSGKIEWQPPVTVSFPEPHRSAATNTVGRSFTVAGICSSHMKYRST